MIKISKYIFKRFLAGVLFYALVGVLFLHGEALSATVSFTNASYIHAETGAQTVSVTLSAASAEAVSVNYATSDGTATEPGDYTAASGTLTWAIGETGARTFEIPITDDVLDEGDETVTITLSGPVNCTIAGTNPEKLTIIDNKLVLIVGPDDDFTNIKSALNSTEITNGYTVIVRDGIYTGPDNRDLDFNGLAITVRSESNDPEKCIIDCENSGRGFWFHSGETENSKLSGFSIINGMAVMGGGLYFTGGSSPAIENCSIHGSLVISYGAGIYCSESSSPNFNNCIISDNYSRGAGGGIYCTGASSPVIAGCIIQNNYARGDGGGIYLDGGSAAVISHCDITGNGCGDDGGGVYSFVSSPDITASIVSANLADAGGGGIFCQSPISPNVRDCTISNNKAVRGGGIFCKSGSVAEITGCSITGNESTDHGGGGILCSDASPIIRNCEISDNSSPFHSGGGISCLARSEPVLINCVISRNAAEMGGGIYCYESDPDILNCTVTMNTTDDGGGAISCVFSSPTITNSILWGNVPDEISLYSSELAASFCAVNSGWPGEGNISDDPLLVNQGGGDYHLGDGSPCINAGTPAGAPVDDIEGNPRGTVPCIGAYEYVPEFTSFSLQSSTNQTDWQVVPGDLSNGFAMELNGAVEHYYLNVTGVETNIPLEPGFYEFGDPGEQFYIHVTDTVEGQEFALTRNTAGDPFTINGDHPLGDYDYTGTITGINPGGLDSSSVTVSITFEAIRPEFTSLGLQSSTDQQNWQVVPGDLANGFAMELSGFADDLYYLNVAGVITNIPLEPGFYEFGGQDEQFYIHVTGTGEGQEFALTRNTVGDPFTINGDYLGDYSYTGTVKGAGANGVNSDPVTLSITFFSPETVPEFTSFSLKSSTDQENWQVVPGDLANCFDMDLDDTVEHYYLNVTGVETNIPLEPGFYGFGDPGERFYIHVTGTGKSQEFALTSNTAGDPFTINGNYTLGDYGYTGTITGTNGTGSGDITIGINFSRLQYTLTLALEGNGSTDPLTGDYLYDVRTPVDISATPAAGREFSHWTGDVADPSSSSTTVTMDSDKTVTAVFTPIQRTLTMQVTGSGTTTPAEGDHTYDHGTDVTIRANPATGWDFSYWTGDVTDPYSATTTVTMDGDKTVRAVFIEKPKYTLTMAVSGGGSTQPSTGAHTYNAGSVVNISASAFTGWKFDYWTGGVVNPNSAFTTVTMNSDKTVTAVFTEQVMEYTLTMAVSGNGSTQPSTGAHTYNAGSVVNISASAFTGWKFDYWTGGVANPSSAFTTVTMNSNKTVTAVFTEQVMEYTLTIDVSGGGSTQPSTGAHTYNAGSVVNISASAFTGWEFDHWTGDVADPNSVFTTVTMDGDKMVTAFFVNVVASRPVINSFTAEPVMVKKGEISTLSWNITGADSASIDNGIGDVDPGAGSCQVSPSSSVTYALTASNATGEVTATVTVDVIAEEAVVAGGPAHGSTIGISDGEFKDPPSSMEAPSGSPAGFPFGLLEFTVTGLSPGGTITVYVTTPEAIPAGAVYYKYRDGVFTLYNNVTGLDDGDNKFQITLTDGGAGDADGEANGEIVDPGGPGVQTAIYFPHIASDAVWETEIGLINTSDTQDITGKLTAYNSDGEEVSQSITVNLAPHWRKQIKIGDEFPDPGDIRYIVFESGFDTVQGYTKFYTEGKYRVAVPAVREINDGDMYISHIASDINWWTGIALVNTTGLEKTLTIEFGNDNGGENKTVTLAAGAHSSFMVSSLFNDEAQPDIHSAVIKDAGGIIGLELFGSTGSGDNGCLSGILLKDTLTDRMYYPHVASDNDWWTGIVAYNPSDSDCNIWIYPYTADGTLFTSDIQRYLIAGRDNLVKMVSDLDLPEGTAWFEIWSPEGPVTGFELFGKNSGNQLAGYTAVNINAKEGVFAKLEKDGWTGIAFVNTENTKAEVTLTAYDDAGAVVATQTLDMEAHAKRVDIAEDLFFPDDISSAAYISYSSDRNVVGFQINGSSGDMMLDALPGI